MHKFSTKSSTYMPMSIVFIVRDFDLLEGDLVGHPMSAASR